MTISSESVKTLNEILGKLLILKDTETLYEGQVLQYLKKSSLLLQN